MRRVMLLALLALALPTASLASSIPDFAVIAQGPFPTASTFTNDFSNPFEISITGTNGVTISLMTDSLTCGAGAITTCQFSDGTVKATGPGVPSGAFESSLEAGSFQVTGKGSAAVIVDEFSVALAPTTMVASGHVAFADLQVVDGKITIGSAAINVEGTVIPEPGTLGLLGTGLIGLAGLARRELKL